VGRRGWSAAEWSGARDRWAWRGWVDVAGKATERGRDGRDEVEWRPDRLAAGPWRALGPGRTERLAELTGPMLGAAFESGLLPGQSTLGIANVPAPAPRASTGGSPRTAPSPAIGRTRKSAPLPPARRGLADPGGRGVYHRAGQGAYGWSELLRSVGGQLRRDRC